MGNRERGAIFCQSLRDFPCPVTLGKIAPSFGLHRYKQGLRFVPPDDEGFTLRGDKQRLVYKGRRRSHRITILGDTTFEYDCILEREPENNVISLRMEGAENYDFFRQPDFVKESFLKGSYAVYKKETLVGEGTGKLCHIHRPEVIDARGRRCWGELSVVSNELRITIPEQWLSEAKYPVVVDPTVGTTTVGSQYRWRPSAGDPLTTLMFEVEIPVNRFLVTDAINGSCTGYAYVNSDDSEAAGRPVLYSDNSNKPQTRKSLNENLMDLRVTSSKPKGWRTATFTSNGSIASGTYIWYGIFCEYFWFPRFDTGARCYSDFWDAYTSIPNTYPIYNVNWYDDLLLSMYFTFTSAQNYQRKLTQGVSLSDSRTITGNYKRKTTQTVQAEAIPKRELTIFKNIRETINNFDIATRMLSFFTTIQETLGSFDLAKKTLSIVTQIQDTLGSFDLAARIHSVLASIKDAFSCFELSSISFLLFSNIHDDLNATDTLYHLRNIIRRHLDNVGVRSEEKAGFFYSRAISETALAVSSIARGLFLFIRRSRYGLIPRGLPRL